MVCLGPFPFTNSPLVTIYLPTTYLSERDEEWSWSMESSEPH